MRIDDAAPVVGLTNQAVVIRAAFEGADMAALIQAELNRLHADPLDAGAYMNLGLLYQLVGRREEALGCQTAALLRARLYRQAPTGEGGAPLRLLVLVTQGDLMANTPVELLLEGRPVQVTRLYVDGALPLPEAVPEHDVALVAIGESDAARPALKALTGLAARWPRPVVNDAAAILDLARDRLYGKLQGVAGLVVPPTVRAGRAALAQVAAAALAPGDILPGGAFPLIVRPIGSHAGQGLAKLDDAAALAAYLAQADAPLFYLSPFIDYASPDGHYRKARIALFDGRPHLAHLAIGDHWMVHYLNAGMAEDAAKRAEEAEAMAGFHAGFAARHAAALAEMTRRLGLDYYAIDCAETPGGDLLIFEADVGMVIHALDPPDLYSYKRPQMQILFADFEALLRGRA